MHSATERILRMIGPRMMRPGTLSILIFHRVLPARKGPCGFDIDADVFDAVLSCVGNSCKVLPLGEALKRHHEGNLPSRCVSITFDDGYRDNHDVALPILEKHGLQATFFIATAYLNGGCMWNDIITHALCTTSAPCLDMPEIGFNEVSIESEEDRIKATRIIIDRIKYRHVGQRDELARIIAERCSVSIPSGLMMENQQVVELHMRGMEIGGHTHTHPIMAVENADFLESDLRTNRTILEELTGSPIRIFAYPNGKPKRDYGPRDRELVKNSGYQAAVTTSIGALNNRNIDLFQIPRFTPWDRTCGKFMARLAVNSYLRPAQA